MTRRIVLDAVVGLLCSSPLASAVAACRDWVDAQQRVGSQLILTDLTDFEVRRELVRLRKSATIHQDRGQIKAVWSKIRRLDDLHQTLTATVIDTATWRQAAEFWATVRVAGLPTAPPDALDGDAILAAFAAKVGDPGDEVVVATTNAKHLGRFPGIDARPWDRIG